MPTNSKLSPAIIKLIAQEVHRLIEEDKKKPKTVLVTWEHCMPGKIPAVSSFRRTKKSNPSK